MTRNPKSKIKRTLSVLLVLVMFLNITPISFAEAAETKGLENFTKQNTYVAGQFSDVKSSDWFAENVKTVYELGLMNGNSSTTFNPYGNITQAEALAITARIHKIYKTGNDDFSDIKQEMLAMEPEILEWCNYNKNSPAYKEFYNAWYAPYAYYLYAYVWGEGRGEYPQFPALAFSHVYAPFIETQEPMKRGILVSSLLLGSLPENEFNQINDIPNNSIPDVTYHYDPNIYLFYRAGILTGNDSTGTFSFDSNITRAEVAAIIGRMVIPSLRKRFDLDNTDKTTGSIAEEINEKYIVAACAMDYFFEVSKFPNTVCFRNAYHTTDNGAGNELWLLEGYGENNFGGKSYAYVSVMVFSEPTSYPLGNYTNYDLGNGLFARVVAHNDNPYEYNMWMFTEKLDETLLEETYYQYFDEYTVRFE